MLILQPNSKKFNIQFCLNSKFVLDGYNM